ncbi:MAG: hypothetical protein HW388_911, partial [Dehalococcoidia bacterium]|nr:hypothetical protein [Dehalococcoidia bacterium]
TTETQLADKTTENAALTADLGATREQLAITETKLADRTTEKAALTADLGTTREQLASKTADYEALIGAVGQLEAVRNEKDTLLTRVTSLQNEIAQLEAQRKPLIVESYRGGFKCTGSMEPKITCLDEVTWLANFKPQDIVIGAVIAFTPTAECYLSSSGVAHRVIGIKVEAGIYYYWPKGDANPTPDGCWIPQANVRGYIIELHKDVRPENQALRDMVNSARAALDQAEAAYDQADQDYVQKRDAYDQAKVALDQAEKDYLASRISYATYIAVYNAYTAAYNAVTTAYNAYIAAYNAYSTAYNAWLQAYSLALA